MSRQLEPTESLVRSISASKGEPAWMLELRLTALKLYHETALPSWGPDLSGLDLEHIAYFTEANTKEVNDWTEVPPLIRDTYIKLGIPEAEREYLGGVGAQFDSESVYHRLKASLEAKGVLFENMDVAVQKYPELVREHFMTSCVRIDEHKFAMLHAACWSGGTFIYIPKGVTVELPLQAYFRMQKMRSAQFEHTLIIADHGSALTYIEGCSAPQYNAASLHAGCVEIFVKKNASVRYISIENWSKNTFNLNTKKALVEADAEIKWIGGNMGSGVTMLYPSSVLLGERAKSEALGLVVAGNGQVQDVGAKAIHIGKWSTSIIRSHAVAKDGGKSIYRGMVKILPSALHSTAVVDCDTLLLDGNAEGISLPTTRVMNAHADVAHEARVGKVSEEALFYLMSRGLSEKEAMRVIIGGFLSPVVKSLPLEYAIEFNRLLDLEFDGGTAHSST